MGVRYVEGAGVGQACEAEVPVCAIVCHWPAVSILPCWASGTGSLDTVLEAASNAMVQESE